MAKLGVLSILSFGRNMENTNEKQIYATKHAEGQPRDVAIIGSGPSGFTAAIYTTRGAASTVIFGGEKWGGQLMLTTEVDNYPTQKGIRGPELMQKMKDHATSFGGEFLQKNVSSIDTTKKPFTLTTSTGEKYLANSVIVATGSETRWLGIPGEDKLRGRGVSSCAPCDAPFFKGKNVAVVGGGDSAMEEALVLTKYATLVTMIHRKSEFRASKAMQKRVEIAKTAGKIKVVWDSEVTEFVGEQKLEKIKVKNVKTNKISEMVFDGVFIAIGHIPSTKIYQGKIELDKKGYIVVHESTRTNVTGIFVAGDVHDYKYKQAITALSARVEAI